MNFEPETISTEQLLQFYAMILKELRHRKVVRTNNGPVGDYSEWLVAKKLNLTLVRNGKSGYDAYDSLNVKYQIKGRIVSNPNSSIQLSAIRNLGSHDFDYLIAIVFNDQYEIVKVIKVPHELIEKYAQYSDHVHAHILILRGCVYNDPETEDITSLFLN